MFLDFPLIFCSIWLDMGLHWLGLTWVWVDSTRCGLRLTQLDLAWRGPRLSRLTWALSTQLDLDSTFRFALSLVDLVLTQFSSTWACLDLVWRSPTLIWPNVDLIQLRLNWTQLGSGLLNPIWTWANLALFSSGSTDPTEYDLTQPDPTIAWSTWHGSGLGSELTRPGPTLPRSGPT